jgi:hypothetical protein
MTDKVNKKNHVRFDRFSGSFGIDSVARELWRMRKFSFLLLAILMGCGGSLSDEQRKKLREGLDEQKIVRLSDSEIVMSSLERGRSIFNSIEARAFLPDAIDSIERQYHVRINLITPGADDALEVENQLIEAYVVGAETGSVPDNIQKLGVTDNQEQYDSLMYTKPQVTSLPDGAVKVEGIWNIYLAKKDIIRSLSEE